MRYKTTKKILIDKMKLDILLRLNCPKDILIDLILYNKFTKTGDDLIDENLESLIDIKEFNNWGGKRPNSGRKNQVENQLENQDENHLENQDVNQDEDKDKDIDIDNIYLYMRGEYKNVYLPDDKIREFEALCFNKKLANEIIEYLSQQIEQGKDEDYNSSKPNAHFVRLKQLLQYRRKHPDKFITPVDTSSVDWIRELEKKYGEG